jgi:riboflavin biosynthesis pyrimidine reductase
VKLYRILPPPSEVFDLTVALDMEMVAAELAPPAMPWVRAIMVTNALGDIVGHDGTSESLTRGADRALLGLHRRACDVIVVGAQTVRSERIPVPASTPLAVVTQSGELGGHHLLPAPGSQVFVVTRPAGVSRVHATLGGLEAEVLIVEGSGVMSGAEVKEALSLRLGAQRFLLEGGGQLWESWASLIDEVALSVTPPPNDIHRGIPSWWPLDTESWQLTSLMTDDAKMLYHRYQTSIRGAPS